MPTIKFSDRVIQCKQDENLRRVLLRAKAPLYNGIAQAIHCRGLGTCGTCAVEISGPVSAMTTIENLRLRFPPHDGKSDLRLACQCRVLGDLTIVKRQGLWGNMPEPVS